MKKLIMVQSNIQVLYLALSISLSIPSAFAAFEPVGSGEMSPIDKQLFAAIKENKPEDVERLLREGADVDSRNSLNNTPLHCAALNGTVKIVQLLLDNGASLEARGHFNYTPLHRAVFNGFIKVVQLLLTKRALLEARDHRGNTPLHRAAIYNHEKVVDLLISKKANLEARDNKNCTPLHRAAWYGAWKVTHLLINAKANVEARNMEEFTPLHHAVSSTSQDYEVTVNALLSAGADKEAVTNKNESSLKLAVTAGNPKVIYVLLNLGLRTNVNILEFAFKRLPRDAGETIIHMLLLHDTFPLLQAASELLTSHSFNLTTFEKNRESFALYWKELKDLLQKHCSIPPVLADLIWKYHNCFELYTHFFPQAQECIPRRILINGEEIVVT